MIVPVARALCHSSATMHARGNAMTHRLPWLESRLVWLSVGLIPCLSLNDTVLPLAYHPPKRPPKSFIVSRRAGLPPTLYPLNASSADYETLRWCPHPLAAHAQRSWPVLLQDADLFDDPNKLAPKFDQLRSSAILWSPLSAPAAPWGEASSR